MIPLPWSAFSDAMWPLEGRWVTLGVPWLDSAYLLFPFALSSCQPEGANSVSDRAPDLLNHALCFP